MGCRWLPRRATSAGRCARSVPTGRTCSCSILEASPDTAIVILTMQGEPGLARAALRAGARAFVLKDEAGAELVAAVRAAATGSRNVNPQLGARIAAEPDGRAEPPDHLNDRELEVLKLVAVGHTSMEIGRTRTRTSRRCAGSRARRRGGRPHGRSAGWAHRPHQGPRSSGYPVCRQLRAQSFPRARARRGNAAVFASCEPHAATSGSGRCAGPPTRCVRQNRGPGKRPDTRLPSAVCSAWCRSSQGRG